jgi:hypothetical protein
MRHKRPSEEHELQDLPSSEAHSQNWFDRNAARVQAAQDQPPAPRTESNDLLQPAACCNKNRVGDCRRAAQICPAEQCVCANPELGRNEVEPGHDSADTEAGTVSASPLERSNSGPAAEDGKQHLCDRKGTNKAEEDGDGPGQWDGSSDDDEDSEAVTIDSMTLPGMRPTELVRKPH